MGSLTDGRASGVPAGLSSSPFFGLNLTADWMLSRSYHQKSEAANKAWFLATEIAEFLLDVGEGVTFTTTELENTKRSLSQLATFFGMECK